MLNGIRVLDFTSLLPGPFASKILADLGAEVLSIKNPRRSDMTEHVPPFVGEKSLFTLVLEEGKTIYELDLKKNESREKILNLAEQIDVVLEQFRPGVMDRLGMGYTDFKERNPKIVYCSITGYGSKIQKAGHDINFLAYAGVAEMLNSTPKLIGTQLGDLVGGSLYAVIGILSALINKIRNGSGKHVQISMSDCLVPLFLVKLLQPLAGEPLVPIGRGLLDGGSIYDYYKTSDGKYLAVGSLEKKFFDELMKGLGLKYSGTDYLFDTELKTKIAQTILSQPLSYWKDKFENLDACVEPVRDIGDYLKENAETIEMNGRRIWRLKFPVEFFD